MGKLLVLGAGTAGTMVANKLRQQLTDDWTITIVDQDDTHHYQPGYLMLPFGTYTPKQIVRRRSRFIGDGIDLRFGTVDRIDTDRSVVEMRGGETLPYDQLVIATGAGIHPEETPGMMGEEWQRSVFDFYSLEGATALRDKLKTFTGGRLVVHITEMPIKCPVAPLEFAFLADDHFTERGIRDAVDITYVTPLDGAFTKPVASAHLGGMLSDRNINVETDFMVERIDNDAKALVSYDEREIPFDLLVTVPLHMGAEFVGRSGLGDELRFVKVDKHTLQAVGHDNIFALGDASNIPASKAGSVAHFAAEIFTENFLDHIAGRPMAKSFDGHANCFVESGKGKGLLIDFNYDTQPLPGTYPLAGVGPLALLKESRLNHIGKLAFRWIYWHMLLPGRRLPVPALMSMRGKVPAPEPTQTTGEPFAQAKKERIP